MGRFLPKEKPKMKPGLVPLMSLVVASSYSYAFVPLPPIRHKRNVKPDASQWLSMMKGEDDSVFFDMEAQRQSFARRYGYQESPLSNTEASFIPQEPQYGLPKHKERNFIVDPTDDMLVEKQALAARIKQHLAAVDEWIAKLELLATGDFVPPRPVTEPSEGLDGAPSEETDSVVVEAELVSPLATSGEAIFPNLYQIGAELQNEARKTAEQRAAVAALARNVTALRRTRALEGSANELSSLDLPSQDASSLHWDELDRTAQQLEDAAQNSQARLSALERTKALLLEMQSQVESIERRVQATAAIGNRTLADQGT